MKDINDVYNGTTYVSPYNLQDFEQHNVLINTFTILRAIKLKIIIIINNIYFLLHFTYI